MIIKTDKDGNQLESWPSLTEAAKAIGISPKVLKGHINKQKPQMLFGFIFLETFNTPVSVLSNEGDLFIQEGETKENLKPSIELDKSDSPIFKQITAQTDLLEEPTNTKRYWEVAKATHTPTVELDEFGEPIIPNIPEEAQGHIGIPPELVEDELLIVVEEEEPIDKEAIADYLRTPLERRLYEMRNKNR